MPRFAFNCKKQSLLQEDREETANNLGSGDQQIEENKYEEITTVCHLCGVKITGAALTWNGINVAGALALHLN